MKGEGGKTDATIIASKKVEAILKSRYKQIGHDDSERIVDATIRFFADLEGARPTRSALLEKGAGIMRTAFGFEEVSVLTRGADGLYRYEIVLGFGKEPERELRSLVYTEAQIHKLDTMASIKVSKYLDMTIAEAEQEEEQRVGYTHPQLMAMPRKNFEEFTYGDYLDVYVYGMDDKCVAVFELSAPRDRKLPSPYKLKGLELFAIHIGMILQYKTR